MAETVGAEVAAHTLRRAVQVHSRAIRARRTRQGENGPLRTKMPNGTRRNIRARIIRAIETRIARRTRALSHLVVVGTGGTGGGEGGAGGAAHAHTALVASCAVDGGGGACPRNAHVSPRTGRGNRSHRGGSIAVVTRRALRAHTRVTCAHDGGEGAGTAGYGGDAAKGAVVASRTRIIHARLRRSRRKGPSLTEIPLCTLASRGRVGHT